MSAWTDFTERFRALVFRGRQERELDEEMRFHLEREIEERVRQGASPEEARRQALLAFGGVAGVKDAVRDASGVNPLRDLAGDLRFALRGLRRNPGFALTAILVLGVGIGAITTAFSVTDAVLISQLPFPETDRLVRIFPRQERGLTQLSTVDFQAIREQQKSFDELGAMQLSGMALSGTGDPENVAAGRVTAGFFRALSVVPAAGRLVQESDEILGAPPVVVVSHALAEDRLGGAGGAVGRSITLDGVSYQVIGVLPREAAILAGFRGRVWPALQIPAPTRRGPFWLRGIARLRDGVTIEDATQDLAGISTRLFPIWQSSFQDAEARLTPVSLREAIVGTSTGSIRLFAGAVTLVLLIAIANVATLLLVRASARTPELAVRVAIGAPRFRLARLVLVEGFTLTILAGLVGIALAALSVTLITGIVPGLPRLAEVSLGVREISFAAGVTLIAGLLVSLSPVSLALRHPTSSSLRTDIRRIGASRGGNLVRGALVVAEFALALPLLLGAGLLLNSVLRLERVDPGFDATGMVTASITLPRARYDSAAAQAFWRRAEARLAEVPAFTAAGLTTELPPTDPGNVNNFELVDFPTQDQPLSPWIFATNGYLEALGVRLVEGRLFILADSTGAPPVAVVSQAWANRFFPGGGAVGREFWGGGCRECPRTTIVGVVQDVKYMGLDQPAEAIYIPMTQSDITGLNLVARSSVGAGEALGLIREVVRSLDPELPAAEATMESRIETTLANQWRWTAVIGGFGAAAVLLAAMGIFGLMSYSVRQRRREIGVRLALGAEPGSVTWMIVARGMRLAAYGAVIGVVLALIEARWLRSMLFDVGPTDPATLVAAAAALFVAAFVASWFPGWRAAKIPPVEAIAVD